MSLPVYTAFAYAYISAYAYAYAYVTVHWKGWECQFLKWSWGGKSKWINLFDIVIPQ